MNKPVFKTDFIYHDRETKQQYVALKYEKILKGTVLDVGADEGYIRKYLPESVNYVGIGMGGKNEDIVKVDLETERIPYPDKYFDCVMCLDVLEHLENIHDVFDELCRVSKQWVLISLPNAYNDIVNYLSNGKYMGREYNTKYYGLPEKPVADRHKWFFSSFEAANFVKYRAGVMKFEIYDYYAARAESMADVLNVDSCFKGFLPEEVTTTTMWWVLRRI